MLACFFDLKIEVCSINFLGQIWPTFHVPCISTQCCACDSGEVCSPPFFFLSSCCSSLLLLFFLCIVILHSITLLSQLVTGLDHLVSQDSSSYPTSLLLFSSYVTSFLLSMCPIYMVLSYCMPGDFSSCIILFSSPS